MVSKLWWLLAALERVRHRMRISPVLLLQFPKIEYGCKGTMDGHQRFYFVCCLLVKGSSNLPAHASELATIAGWCVALPYTPEPLPPYDKCCFSCRLELQPC